MRFNYLIILFFITLLSISCTENDNNSSTDGYDRSSLLSNMVDNIMIPAHQNFDSQLELFESAVNSFGQDRSISNLDEIALSSVSGDTSVLEDIDIIISNIKLHFDELYANLQNESE